ncbi:MAG TPA: PilZ domain-containing protein [bacterium]|nr:PilZ domain-containing protein [bacterium]HOL47281.1 PilZ domain-containing protein [bacterium]HPQ18691.1 PilZ domain-containing protein [bacterium]
MNISKENKNESLQKRKSWRAKATTKITVFWRDKVLTGTTDDIGEGGLKFNLSEEIPLNEIILLQINDLSFEKIKTKILSCDSIKVNLFTYRGQFINFPSSLKNQLLKFIFDRFTKK